METLSKTANCGKAIWSDQSVAKACCKIKLISNDSELFAVELKFTGQEKAKARKKETPKKLISVKTFSQIIDAVKSGKKCKLTPLKSLQYVGMFTFIRFLGLRVVSELWGMRWDHVHDEMITIYSPKTAHREASERKCPVFKRSEIF